jgi:hypothetical protein
MAMIKAITERTEQLSLSRILTVSFAGAPQ